MLALSFAPRRWDKSSTLALVESGVERWTSWSGNSYQLRDGWGSLQHDGNLQSSASVSTPVAGLEPDYDSLRSALEELCEISSSSLALRV